MDILEPPVNTTIFSQLCPYRMKPCMFSWGSCRHQYDIPGERPPCAEVPLTQGPWSNWHKVSRFCWRKIEKQPFFKTLFDDVKCIIIINNNMVQDWISQITLPGDLCNVNESGDIFGARSLSAFIRDRSRATTLFELLWLWRNIKMITAE